VGEASRFERFGQEYTAAPEVTRKRSFNLETMEKVLAGCRQDILEPSSEQGGGQRYRALMVSLK